MTTPSSRPPITTGVLLFDDAEELDYVGPWEVLTMARKEGDSVVTIAQGPDPIRSAEGPARPARPHLRRRPATRRRPRPGWHGNATRGRQPRADRLARQGQRSATWVTSVCTGSFLLHAAGPARDGRVTTHWAAIEELRDRAPDLTVVEHVRWVVDGNVVTAAGVSAGIDMALWLVGQLYDVAHARAVQRFIQYDPAPPYQADL